MKFPEDFTVKNHQIVQNAKQWLLKKDNEIIILSLKRNNKPD